METVMPMDLFDVDREARQHLRCRHAVQPPGARQIEKGLVDRQWLDQRRQAHSIMPRTSRPTRAYFSIFGPDHLGVRTAPQRLEHRHRRSHAESARHIAGGGDYSALTAADDHRFGGKRRIVAFLDGGIKRVAIDMGDRKGIEFSMAQQARRAAARATCCGSGGMSARQSRQKPTAQPKPRIRGYRVPIDRRARSRARATAAGLMPALSAKATSNFSSASICSSTPARKPGSRAAVRICPAGDTAYVEKAGKRMRVLGDEGKRLNRQHFRRFSRRPRCALSWGSICVSVTYRD